MDLGGIVPGQDEVETKDAIKLPKRIPKSAIFEVRELSDVDALPRGAIVHLLQWDDDIAFDLVVAGVGITLLNRKDKEELESHDDFDPDGFGVLDDEGIWLPGLEKPYAPDGDGWVKPADDGEAPRSEQEMP